ncbi:MAG: FAD-dependent oxidoreductase [Deltaproteobacteria bacterium]|nr:FAD-dependent oxidoreductase [Deltaproteobacteria bacterium]MBW2051707.1 FAD-dependent oxidoreductase [Deltaproteobacteria bacterium]MBW2140246.1 FAD-dependent oxidoreductase [Deltaproteobacteria bacterium]MBW2323324.1 FAD-dependent oxidoreductase [Deltaproteobacteria bacterium]
MAKKNASLSRADKFLPKEAQEELKVIFAAVPHDIFVYLFSQKDDDQQVLQMGRELIQAFQEISDRIKFKEYNLSHKQAKKWEVTTTPSLVFSPERYSIKYLGIPLGEEGRTLLETLMLIGLGDSQASDQARKVIQKIDTPRKVNVFVSSTCPYCPQQAINAIKAAIENPGLISASIIDTGFNPELTERYSAFSVPQTFANDVLIAKGAQPQELFAASLDLLEEQHYFIPLSDAERVETDLVIIGGGPAGLTAGIYAVRSGLNTVIVERENLGGQVATTPIVENYPGLAHVGGKNLVDIMVAHALEYVKIFPREPVMEINPDSTIEVVTAARRFTARAVIFATGASYRRLGVPGESRLAGRGVSYCSTCDGPLFVGKEVVIVGGGNSAVTEAIHLHHMGVKVALIHRGDTLRAQEHLVKDLQADKIPVLWNTEVKEIRGKERVTEIEIYNNKDDQTEIYAADGVFISIGYIPEVDLAKKTGLELTSDGFIKQDGQHRTNIPRIYSAGDVEGGYKQIVTAAGAGAAAAMTVFEDLTQPYWKEKEIQGKR